jgi:hypothetical protein
MPSDDLAHSSRRTTDAGSSAAGASDDLLVIDRFARAGHRLLHCKACRARFSEFKGTPLFHSKLPREKVLAILGHLAEGCDTRQTARLVGINTQTVTPSKPGENGSPALPFNPDTTPPELPQLRGIRGY